MEGDNTTILIVIGVLLALLVLGWLFARRRRTDTLREHFGDEYQRTVETQGGRGKAEAECWSAKSERRSSTSGR